MPIFETNNGRLVVGNLADPQDVTLHLWTRQGPGGSVIGGKTIGKTNSLREAESMAKAAGYELRGKAIWMPPNGIIVAVVATPEEIADAD